MTCNEFQRIRLNSRGTERQGCPDGPQERWRMRSDLTRVPYLLSSTYERETRKLANANPKENGETSDYPSSQELRFQTAEAVKL